jgi:hypothetical protein
MNLKLIRNEFRQDGIFGTLETELGKQLAITLEHAYADLQGWSPKLPDGDFVCVRGTHRLDHSSGPFETFQIIGVPGHTGILFHIGNFNFDSDGCVLLGENIVQMSGARAISSSKITFQKFMDFQSDVDEFSLNVSSAI